MIFRDHRMIIPHGDDQLLPHDNAYFIGDPRAIEKFSVNFVQSDTKRVERAIIIGAGRTGRFLAPMLDKQGVQVKIFDKNRERCLLAAEKMDNGIAICGDGTDLNLLEQEGIAEADVVVCITDDDRLNLMLALIAKHFGAKKTIVRVSRAEYTDLMEKVGVDIGHAPLGEVEVGTLFAQGAKIGTVIGLAFAGSLGIFILLQCLGITRAAFVGRTVYRNHGRERRLDGLNASFETALHNDFATFGTQYLLGIGNLGYAQFLGHLRAHLCGIAVDGLTSADNQVEIAHLAHGTRQRV